MAVKKTIKAWTAGIIDGEGYVGLVNRKGRKKKQPTVDVFNTNMLILNRLKENFGGYLYLNKRPSRPNSKPCWQWTLKGRKCVVFLNKIKPFLCGKLDKAEMVIKYGEYLLNS